MQSVSFQQNPPGHTVAMWEVYLVQIFDEGAEAGGVFISFCLISSSITVIDLPVLANTEKLACLRIFHCIDILPINMWISTVLLPLEKGIRNLYSECRLTVIFWEGGWKLELTRRQETLESWLLSCIFVMYTSIMTQLALLFKRKEGPGGIFV